MNKIFYTKHLTPFGELTLLSDGTFLNECLLPNEPFRLAELAEENASLPVFIAAKNFLDAYFHGEQLLLPPLQAKFSDYTSLILQETLNISYGETISYQELARRLNKPNHARSVGNALGKNPLPIFIPCHRIVKVDGTIGGYTGGADFKRKLLEHEGKTKER